MKPLRKPHFKVSLANFCQLPLVWIFLKILYSDIDMWVTWGSIFAAVLPHVPGTCIATQAQETFPAVGVDRREDAADKPQFGVPRMLKKRQTQSLERNIEKKGSTIFFFSERKHQFAPGKDVSAHVWSCCVHLVSLMIINDLHVYSIRFFLPAEIQKLSEPPTPRTLVDLPGVSGSPMSVRVAYQRSFS